MDSAEIIATIFNTIRQSLDPTMRNFGFQIDEERYAPEAFGNRYVRYRQADKVVLFVWDGKEEWFMLETCHHINRKPFPDWQELATIKLDSCTMSENVINPTVVTLDAAIDRLKMEFAKEV